jgi:hypothetical protein
LAGDGLLLAKGRMRCRMGSVKAAVLPVPVWAPPMMSFTPKIVDHVFAFRWNWECVLLSHLLEGLLRQDVFEWAVVVVGSN